VLAISPSVLKHLAFDPVRDFTGVALLATVPVIVVVRPESPLRSIADIIAAARARGTAVSYASFGIGTPPHLIGPTLRHRILLCLTHPPLPFTLF
jgi:tripartite-type tricarboxylate transporter receptor subunit TctC